MRWFNNLSRGGKIATLLGGLVALYLLFFGAVVVIGRQTRPAPTAVARVASTPIAVPPTATPLLPTDTPSPPTSTPVSQTATPQPLTVTSLPATATPAPPTATPTQPTTIRTSITSELKLGEPWEQEGVQLNLVKVDIRAGGGGESAAVHAWFRFFNKTGQKLLVEMDWNDIYLEDSLGNRYVDWDGGGTNAVWVEAGRSLNFDRYYTTKPGERSRVPSGAEFVTVIAERFSRVRDARWRVDINPPLSPIPAPEPGTVKRLGESWKQAGLELKLKDIDIRAGEGASRLLSMSGSAWRTKPAKGSWSR